MATQVSYTSQEALVVAGDIAAFVRRHADAATTALAGQRGAYPLCPPHKSPRRNLATLALPPTGGTALLMRSSYSIEPHFRAAHTVPPLHHVAMQAAWQAHVDGAVSKTVNMPHSASVEDVLAVYQKAAQCVKGVTVFRDGCLPDQPIRCAQCML